MKNKLSEQLPENFAVAEMKKNKTFGIYFTFLIISLFTLLGFLIGIYLKLAQLVEIMSK
jgi:hypothetical protein